MFYSQFILAKKGPLGTIWIAAHLERKLRKNQVADTDIGVSVDSILFPEVPIALRLSSHLLLGVVRIYSRKVNYLFDDCSEALLKVKQAFRSTAVDLPPEESTAPYHSITLPETFDLDDFELPDNEIFQGNYVDHHISTREQITLQDTMDGVAYSTSQFGFDERFGDGDTSQINLDIDEELFLGKNAALGHDGISGANVEASVEPMTPWEKDENNEEIPQTSQAVLVDSSGNEPGGVAVNAEFIEYAQAPSTPGLVEEPNLSSVQKALAHDDHLEAEDRNSTELVATQTSKNAFSEPEYHNADKNGLKWSVYNDPNHDTIESMPPEENGYHSKGLEIQKFQEGSQAEVVKPIPSVSESSDGIRAQDGSNKVLNVQNGVPSNDELGMPCADQTDGECVDSTVRLDETVASPTSHVTSDFEKSHSPNKAGVSGGATDVDLETLSHTAIPEETTSAHMHVLQPCSQRNISSLGGEEHHPVSGGEIEEDSKKLDEEADNLISSDNPLENTNNLATSDMPAPERLLSVPEDLHDKASDLMVASTPEKGAPEGGDAIATGTKLISGKKRSFTESTITVESINSVETFGVIRSKRTAESIPDDDDLLSSILVGRRSTVLKMKPTPPVPEVTSMKRSRSTHRPSALKRKVLMDDSMVLHGDTIRQQLTNTEDIRRMRKKAPCTRPEILMIQRQFLEDEIFSEPIFTGMSAELTWLHCEPYDLSGIRISENDANQACSEVAKLVECSVRPNVTEETGMEGGAEPILGHDGAQPAENSMHSENQQVDDRLDSHDFGTHGYTNSVTKIADFRNSQQDLLAEVTEMEIDRGSTEVADAANHHKTEGIDGFQETDELCLSTDRNIEAQPVNEGASLVDTIYGKGSNEHDVDEIVRVENELEATDKNFMEESGCGALVGNRTVCQIQTDSSAPIDNGGQAMEDIENSMAVLANEYGVLATNMNFDSKDPSLHFTCDEEPRIGSMYSAEISADTKHNNLNDDENSNFQKADLQSDFDTEITAFGPPPMEECVEFEHMGVENDTEFLNVDDDDVVEEDDDGVADAEETRLLDNTGWSSRTRAVAKYLQILFEKEAVYARKVLPMDNLLVGKTRKEASRMFFETLVLKTKDYIHVEQARPFDNINIKPQGKLVKSDF